MNDTLTTIIDEHGSILVPAAIADLIQLLLCKEFASAQLPCEVGREGNYLKLKFLDSHPSNILWVGVTH